MSSETNGTEDEDCLFLEQVLDKLYDFGDGPTSEKKVKAQKKKKRKRCDGEEGGLPTAGDACRDTEDCRADCNTATEAKQQPETEPRGPSLQPVKQVEVVKFQDPTKKPKTKQKPAPETPAVQVTEKKQSDQLQEPDLEKARLEVHRFGITGYKKEEQRVFEQDRAIMLGARPPKKSYVNYKMLQAQIKKKKQKAKEESQMDLKKNKKMRNNDRDEKKKKKASSGSGSAPSGHLGHFKGGMLVLSSKEIQMIKGNK